MGKGSNAVMIAMWAIVFLAIGIIGTISITNYAGTSKASGLQEEILTSEENVAKFDCPDTLKNQPIVVYDKATESYLATTVNIYDEKGQFKTNTTTSSAGVPVNVQACGNYKAVVMTTAGTSGTASADFFVGSNDASTLFLYVSSLDNLQVRAVDQDTGADLYIGTDNAFLVNGTSASDVNSTLIATTAGDVAKAVGADGSLNYDLYLKAETAKKYFGDPNLKTYVCVDLGSNNVWEEPSISINGATPLTDVKGSLKGNDQGYTYVSNSEYCYDMGMPISNGQIKLSISDVAQSGQNPGASDDIILYFLPEGVFKSVKSATLGQALSGIATDASTKAGAGFGAGHTPKITLETS